MTTAAPNIGAAYLKDVIRQLRMYKGFADKAIARVPDAHLHTELDASSNSIAVIVKHVAGAAGGAVEASSAPGGGLVVRLW